MYPIVPSRVEYREKRVNSFLRISVQWLSLLVGYPDEAGRAQRVPLDDQRHGGRAVALRTLGHRVAQTEHPRAEQQGKFASEI